MVVMTISVPMVPMIGATAGIHARLSPCGSLEGVCQIAADIFVHAYLVRPAWSQVVAHIGSRVGGGPIASVHSGTSTVAQISARPIANLGWGTAVEIEEVADSVSAVSGTIASGGRSVRSARANAGVEVAAITGVERFASAIGDIGVHTIANIHVRARALTAGARINARAGIYVDIGPGCRDAFTDARAGLSARSGAADIVANLWPRLNAHRGSSAARTSAADIRATADACAADVNAPSNLRSSTWSCGAGACSGRRGSHASSRGCWSSRTRCWSARDVHARGRSCTRSRSSASCGSSAATSTVTPTFAAARLGHQRFGD